MQLIPMEDFILQEDKSIPGLDPMHDYEAFRKSVAYANFLKTHLTWEHFNGPEAIATIDNCSVLKPSDDKNGSIHLLFVPEEETPFSLSAKATFRSLVDYPGAKLTEAGVKLIFG